MRENIYAPKWFLIVAFFLGGVFLGGLGTYLWASASSQTVFRIRSTAKYAYINPLIAVDTTASQKLAVNRALALQLQNALDGGRRDGSLAGGGIYYRDLESGSWVGINEDMNFSPGRLLHIPLMITYFKLAESDDTELTRELVFKGPNHKSTDHYETGEPLVPGQSYAVEDLIKKMIVQYSDDAANLLFDNVDKASLQEVFSDLGIDFREEKETRDFLTLKQYSMFFRVLYNSTYLTREFSEKALALIDVASDVQGVASGIPKNITVASRIGGWNDAAQGVYEAYDCGIVYYPSGRFLICGAASGKRIEDIESFLRKIGEMAFADANYRARVGE